MITETLGAGLYIRYSWDFRGKGRRQNFQIESCSLDKKIQTS